MRGLKYVSWADHTGYAVAAKSYLRALIEAGVPLTWAPLLPGRERYEWHRGASWPCPQLGAVCNRALEYDTVLIHTVPEYFPEWIERERRAGRRVLGYTVWELERLPAHWPAILNRLDGVLVPCRWNAQVLRRSGVAVPVHVVPHLSQFESGAPVGAQDRARLLARLGPGASEALQGRTVFYTIAHWSQRKAPELAVRAYWRAFAASDPVALIVKTGARDAMRLRRHWRSGFRLRHPAPAAALAELAAGAGPRAPVLLVGDETLGDGELRALHDLGHSYVSLARAEGWGLGAFEAARLGKPVVATGYGGQLDYLDPELALLVDYRLVPVHEPLAADSYAPQQRWAEPSLEHAARQLRAVFADPVSTRARARRLAQRIADEFSREAVLLALRKALA